MHRKLPKRGWRVLLVLLVGSLLAMFAGALPVAAGEYDANPERGFSEDVVAPGEEFTVTVTFTAPADVFEGVMFSDTAPPGWTVSVDKTWCDPDADVGTAPEPDKAEYEWYSDAPWDEGEPFSAVYKVLVPAEAEPGTYHFSGTLSYSIGPEGPLVQPIGGDGVVMIPPPASGDVRLTARTPALTGCLKLVKEFVAPDGMDFPLDEIEVRVTGDDFDETYTLKAGEGWEKLICELELGTYTVEELTVVPGWIPSYDPDDEIEVEAWTEAGDEATITITNTWSVIGIRVEPSTIDFGEITPGEINPGDNDITVTNIGGLNVDVRAELDEDTVYNDAGHYFYTDALRLAGNAASDTTLEDLGAWTAEDLGLEDMEFGDSEDVTTAVECPAEMRADTVYEGKLLFIASASD